MNWPVPKPGQVIRYAYLWHHEAEAGREEGLKDRPCAVLLAIADEEDSTRVIVLPITHSPPIDPGDALELPAATKRRLGLDDKRSWVMLTEGNSFNWPGPDLRPLPGQGPATVLFGELPAALFRRIRDRFLDRYRSRTSRLILRSE